MTTPAEALAVAETLNLNLPQPPGQERIVERRFAAMIGSSPHPSHNVVQRLRLTHDEIAATVAEVRGIFAARNRREATWEIGPSSTPGDLVERLTALGMVPDQEPIVAGMVLSRPLPRTATRVVAERVATLDQYRISEHIYHQCFSRGEPPPGDAETAVDWDRR